MLTPVWNCHVAVLGPEKCLDQGTRGIRSWRNQEDTSKNQAPGKMYECDLFQSHAGFQKINLKVRNYWSMNHWKWMIHSLGRFLSCLCSKVSPAHQPAMVSLMYLLLFHFPLTGKESLEQNPGDRVQVLVL